MEKITDKTGRIAFIGGGMMAEAILKGMLHKEIAEPEMIIISDLRQGAANTLKKLTKLIPPTATRKRLNQQAL